MSRRGTVKRDTGGRWYFVVDVAPAGAARRQVRRRGFRTKREAQAALTETLGTLQRGTFVEPATITVGEYLRTWCDGLPASGLRLSTVSSYSDNVRLHVTPTLGTGRLQSLTATDLDRLYAQLLENGRRDGGGGLSARTVRYIHTILGRALADATRKGLLVRNPARLATPPSARSARAPETAVWTPSQLREFLESLRDHRLYPLLRLAAMTGLRRGELLALRWPDVDLDAAHLSVRRQLSSVRGKARVNEVKSDRGRRLVDIDDETVSTLRAHRTRQLEERLAVGEGWRDLELVFTGVDGEPLQPDRVSKQFGRLVAASGLPTVRFHDLRHSHATHLIAAGVHAKVVSERLGHSSVSFTLDRYGHVLPTLQASAASAVSALVDGDA